MSVQNTLFNFKVIVLLFVQLLTTMNLEASMAIAYLHANRLPLEMRHQECVPVTINMKIL